MDIYLPHLTSRRRIHFSLQYPPHKSSAVSKKRDLQIDNIEPRLTPCGTPDFALSKEKAKILQDKIAAVTKKNLNKYEREWITIEVAYRIISSGSLGDLPDWRLNDQISVLNTAFAPHNIRFTVKNTIRIDDSAMYNTCAMDFDGVSFKAQIRDPNDGPEVLYFYTCDLTEYGGYATYPNYYEDYPLFDGIVCDINTFPGGIGTYGLGQTATHEVGHWLGLLVRPSLQH